MQRSALSIALLSAAAVVGTVAALPSPAAAASAELVGVVTDDGLHTVEYRAPEGTIRVLLPDDLAAGDTISGTVVAEPAGEDEEERETRRATLEGYVVEVAGETTAPGGGATWKVAAGAALPVLLRDAGGKEVARAEVPVLASAPSASTFRFPEVAQAGDPLVIGGPFDGDAGGTAVRLGDAPAEVLAESPRQAVVATEAGVTGPTAVTVAEGDAEARGTVRLLGLGLTADQLSLQRGETTRMTVTVDGLAGVEEPVRLSVTNASPEVVRMEGERLVLIEPSEVDAEGRFTRDWTLTGVVPGGFSIRARVASLEPTAMLPVGPAPGTSAGPRPDFSWRPYPIPGATYDLTLSRVLDETGEPVEGSAAPPEATTELETVLRAEELTEPGYAYPADAPELEPGLYAWRALATIPGLLADVPAGDTGPILISVDRCRCERYGGHLNATLTQGGTRLRTVKLERNPGITRLPPGATAVAITGGDLPCKECRGARCAATGARFTPASPTITPTAATQTLEVTANWNCTREGCQADACEKTYKLKYKLAGDKCECGELLATATIANATPGRVSSHSARLVCHRGVEEPGVIDFSDDLEAELGDRLTVRLSGFAVACWCREGLCTSTASTEDDQTAGRRVTVDLGENDPETNNDNSNLLRAAGGGWQADGSYEFEVVLGDEKTLDRTVFQDVALRARCDADECSFAACRCSWRLGIGGLR